MNFSQLGISVQQTSIVCAVHMKEIGCGLNKPGSDLREMLEMSGEKSIPWWFTRL